jgi:type II secretory pathway pseudopilin PulG
VVRRRGESGYALVTALLVVLLLSIALALLASSLQLRMRLVRQEADALALQALSDAALAETLARLAESSYFHGVNEHPLGGGAIRSDVQFIAPGRFRVVATATLAGRERAVEAEVRRSPGRARVVRWRRLADPGGAR